MLEDLIRINKQLNKGVITTEEAANKALNLVVHSDVRAVPQKYLDILANAQDAQKEKELAVCRLIQAGNKETGCWDKLFNIILLDNGINN